MDETTSTTTVAGAADTTAAAGLPSGTALETETTETQAHGNQDNPFDFSHMESAGDSPQQDVSVPDDAPYVLDMGSDYDGTDETTAMITNAARECGLEAAAAGQFIARVCAGLKAGEAAAIKEATQALMAEWGADYDAHMKGAGQFLATMARRLGIADTRSLMNPAVFRLAHAMRQMGGEKAAAGTTGSDTRTSQQRFDALMSDPGTQAVLMNPLHKDYARVAAEANSCLPSPLF